MVCDVPLAQSWIEPCRMISNNGEIRMVQVSCMRKWLKQKLSMTYDSQRLVSYKYI
jgi:hypothetical protein